MLFGVMCFHVLLYRNVFIQERIENTLVRVYPFARYPLRTKESVSEHAQEAETTGSPVYAYPLLNCS